MADDDSPLANAGKLRAIAALNGSSRINIDKALALTIAAQLEELAARIASNASTPSLLVPGPASACG